MENSSLVTCNGSRDVSVNCSAVWTVPRADNTMRIEVIAVPTIFAAIFVIGVFGNVAMICAILCHRNINPLLNSCLLNLAVGNLLMLVASMPFVAILYAFDEWPFGVFVCKLNEFVQLLSNCVTIFTLTAISVEQYRLMSTPRHFLDVPTWCIVVVVWVLSVSVSLPEFISADVIQFKVQSRVIHVCSISPPEWGPLYPKLLTAFRLVIQFAVPLVVIAVLNFSVVRKLIAFSRGGQMKESSNLCTNAGGADPLSPKRQVAMTVAALVITFTLCWSPRHVYLMWYHFNEQYYNKFWHVFKIIGYCLMFSNSCINPVLLYFMDKRLSLCLIACTRCTKYKQERDLELATTIQRKSSRVTDITVNYEENLAPQTFTQV